MLAFWLLRRLRSLRACLRRLRIIIVLKGPALRWTETKRYLDEHVVNNRIIIIIVSGLINRIATELGRRFASTVNASPISQQSIVVSI